MDDLYHQTILDHYKHPRNQGKISNPDITITETNQTCGDTITLYLKIDYQALTPIIKDIKFEGTGCAVSTAAASLLTQELIGQDLASLKKVNLDYMQKLIGAKVSPGRIKCLTLAATAFNQAITIIQKHASTT